MVGKIQIQFHPMKVLNTACCLPVSAVWSSAMSESNLEILEVVKDWKAPLSSSLLSKLQSMSFVLVSDFIHHIVGQCLLN